MKVSDVSKSEFIRELRSPGIWLQTGPFTTHLESPIELLGQTLHLLYADFPISETREFADFHLRIDRPANLRRWYRPQALFWFDDQVPFKPLALNHAFAMFEWCLNWTIETQANQYLMIHAAIIERNGRAAILAAPPGSGKSTLAAGLVCRGWRLLSDELTIIDLKSGRAVPLARPASLKNESIEVIRNFMPGAVIGPVVSDTIKGSVGHLKPPSESVRRVGELALPEWVIFPKFLSGAPPTLTAYARPTALLRLADNAFNYSQHGVAGFEVLSELIERCGCYEFTYSSLDDAIAVFDSLNPSDPNARRSPDNDVEGRTGPAWALQP